MGVHGLAPADNLGAVYDPAEQSLILSAEGEASKWTYGFEFKRIPWLGGLKYELVAWSGPHVPGTRKYTHTQRFNISNLSSVDPAGDVDIVTANHRMGKIVPIYWLGLSPGNSQLNGSLDGQHKQAADDLETAKAIPEVLDVDASTLCVLYGQPFNIKETAVASPEGSINIRYSSFALMITNAGIDNGDMVWTFNALETGKTQAVVYKSTGIGKPIIRKVYNINVCVLDNALIAGDALSGTPKPGLNAILDFEARVFIALNIVRRTTPDAQLSSVKATLPRGVVYPVTDPLRLSQLDCLFLTDSGTATIHSTGWGEFAPPVFVPGKPLGAGVIDVTGLKIDITDAVDLMRNTGHTGAFWSASLERPVIGPGELGDEPHYIFHMVDGSYVFVGTQSEAVIVNNVREKALPSQKITVKLGEDVAEMKPEC